jgi:hypothetical protein
MKDKFIQRMRCPEIVWLFDVNSALPDNDRFITDLFDYSRAGF